MAFRTKLFGITYDFKDVKEVLAKANEQKSGDEAAGVAAKSVAERIAAKAVLAEIPMWVLRAQPVVPYEDDEITRAIDDGLDLVAYEKIKNKTAGEMRAWILNENTSSENIAAISHGLTGEMAAAVAKLCSSLDLIVGGKKMPCVVHNVCTMGLPGRIGARLQPNHPTDDIDAIRAEIYDGLSFCMGDQVIGINPAIDQVENLMKMYDMMWDIKEKWSIPASNCILGHITTQMECLKKGAKVGQVFQSIAGTQAALESFGVEVGMLDEANELAKKYCYSEGPNFFYFETGEGTELSAYANNDADQLTLEARKHALARRYNPIGVNSVVGFIGPEYLYNSDEIMRAALEDHFCGKLLGIPLGLDNCYTNHVRADQNTNEFLMVLDAVAGCNYHMSVPMGDDVMLSYQCASYHDTASLWSAMGTRPAPEWEKWCEDIGLLKNGKLTDKAGDASFFLKR
jgi:ethanolamine ammonia-lyase large subunit